MKVLSQEVENVLEAKEIFGRRLAKRFVRLEHRFCLLPLSGIKGLNFRGLFKRFTFRRTGAIAVDVKYLVQSEPGKKLLTPIAAMNNVKVTVPQFL
jgi:hypothetical protein